MLFKISFKRYPNRPAFKCIISFLFPFHFIQQCPLSRGQGRTKRPKVRGGGLQGNLKHRESTQDDHLVPAPSICLLDATWHGAARATTCTQPLTAPLQTPCTWTLAQTWKGSPAIGVGRQRLFLFSPISRHPTPQPWGLPVWDCVWI